MRACRAPIDRIAARVALTDSGCLVWLGSLNHAGYGAMALDGVRHPAHRAVYMVMVGPVPARLDLDHLCRNRACVNPDHLDPTTRSENLRRGLGGRPRAATITHCLAGHPFDAENTYLTPGTARRNCRACHRISNRNYARRNR